VDGISLWQKAGHGAKPATWIPEIEKEREFGFETDKEAGVSLLS
jgi:hypothetical protein